MGSSDSFATEPNVATTVESELHAAGFEDPQEIGRGGFGVVYRCVQPELDRIVAVKVLTRDIDEDNRVRFLREQRAMGRVTGHPHIVNVLQVGVTGSGLPYLVMQYHRRDSLLTAIRRDGPLPVSEVLRLGVKMAGAVETAHRNGILHRDIKPGNILFTRYGEPALTDFGIAHLTGGFETAVGMITGSPAFTAPEVLSGAPPSPVSDVYSLAATLFCALTGHAAFERHTGEEMVAQFVRISSQPVPDLREQGIPDSFATVLERAMARRPESRPASAAEFGDELRGIEYRCGLAVHDMALLDENGEHDNGEWRDGHTGSQPPRGVDHFASMPRCSGSADNLPLELTSFVGRRRELVAAGEKLASARLLTLTGIGGVGKTRLALQIAAGARTDFPHGVWLVELAELLDGSLLADTVAAALGLRNQSATPTQDLLIERLARRRALIVLDNCEQLIDAVARLTETLLRSCPELRILTTTREPLDIEGEVVLRVPPLAVPDPDRESTLIGFGHFDAVTLFEERAAAAVAGFALTDDNLAAVVQICRRLDGLPLAIELAAARLRAISVEQLLQRLTDRYRLLTHGSRGAPTRQQTLHLCVEWSHELCTPREQQVWAQLSVFAGSFELDAAEGICVVADAPDELLDCLASLVDKSILIREEIDGVVRFRMLETLREFGREKAQAAGEYEALRRRHFDWYRRLALDTERKWLGADQLDRLARLGREQPNLREAMEFALADPDGADSGSALQVTAALFFPLWLSRNLLSEGRYWLDRALSEESAHPSPQRVQALYAVSVLVELQGELETGGELVAEAQRLAAELGDPVSAARVAHAEGLRAIYTGDVSRACTRLEEALEVFAAEGDLTTQVWILMMLGLAYDLDGRPEPAIACHEKVLAITAARGESVYRSYSLWALGTTVFRQGDLSRATGLLRECLRLCRLVDEPLVTAISLEVLAWIAAADQRATDAAMLLGAAEALGAAVGSSPLLFPELTGYHDSCVQVTRETLGEDRFRAGVRRGARLEADRAIAFCVDAERRTVAAEPMLTTREREVATLVARGLNNNAIAVRLSVSPQIVQGYLEQLRKKLGVGSKKQIAAWVRSHRGGAGPAGLTRPHGALRDPAV